MNLSSSIKVTFARTLVLFFATLSCLHDQQYHAKRPGRGLIALTLCHHRREAQEQSHQRPQSQVRWHAYYGWRGMTHPWVMRSKGLREAVSRGLDCCTKVNKQSFKSYQLGMLHSMYHETGRSCSFVFQRSFKVSSDFVEAGVSVVLRWLSNGATIAETLLHPRAACKLVLLSETQTFFFPQLSIVLSSGPWKEQIHRVFAKFEEAFAECICLCLCLRVVCACLLECIDAQKLPFGLCSFFEWASMMTCQRLAKIFDELNVNESMKSSFVQCEVMKNEDSIER